MTAVTSWNPASRNEATVDRIYLKNPNDSRDELDKCQ